MKRWYDIIKDIYLTKVFAKVKEKPKRKPPKYKIPIYFDNKGFEFIRLNSILRHKEVKEKLPERFRDDETPSIVYSLSSTVRNKILNYK